MLHTGRKKIVQKEKDREKGMKDQLSLRFINKQMTGPWVKECNLEVKQIRHEPSLNVINYRMVT